MHDLRLQRPMRKGVAPFALPGVVVFLLAGRLRYNGPLELAIRTTSIEDDMSTSL